MRNDLGVLFPVASLDGRHGIGDFGKPSINFVKFLKENNFLYWQVLPLNPIGPGNSPYMSTCSFALEDRYISLDELVKDGLLENVPSFQPLTSKVDFVAVKEFKEKYLRKAYKKFALKPLRGYKTFKKRNPWLAKFALFNYFKTKNVVSWNKWDKKELTLFARKRMPKQYSDIVEYESFKQFIAFRQWGKVQKFATKLGINIIADCPFYVGLDSLDCLMFKDQFLMDENYNPTVVSGCPPDAFSDIGQLWGTPIYDFEKMKQDGYSFLINRIYSYSKTCDYLRLDHFRAFDTYCVIPAEDENAKRGEWKIGPRESFFDALFAKYPNIKLIAEDLGELFPSVIELKNHYNLVGMNVTEFTVFDEKYVSDNRQVVYIGTHDNEVLSGWLAALSDGAKDYLKNKFHTDDLVKGMKQYVLSLPSFLTIFQLQDLLDLPGNSRINNPGTLVDTNWSFKLSKFDPKTKISL